MHSFEVHSNESACRKEVRLGLEQVWYVVLFFPNKNRSHAWRRIIIPMPDCVIGIFSASFLSFGEDKIKYMQETIISNWGDINEIDHTNIILNGMYINYSVLCQFSLPNLCPVPLASNIIRMPKLRRFLMRGQQSNLYQRHSLGNIYH